MTKKNESASAGESVSAEKPRITQQIATENLTIIDNTPKETPNADTQIGHRSED